MRKKKKKPDTEKIGKTGQKTDKRTVKGNKQEVKTDKHKEPKQNRMAGTKRVKITSTIALVVLIAANMDTKTIMDSVNNNSNSGIYKQLTKKQELPHEKGNQQETSEGRYTGSTRAFNYPRLGGQDEVSTRCRKNSEEIHRTDPDNLSYKKTEHHPKTTTKPGNKGMCLLEREHLIDCAIPENTMLHNAMRQRTHIRKGTRVSPNITSIKEGGRKGRG